MTRRGGVGKSRFRAVALTMLCGVGTAVASWIGSDATGLPQASDPELYARQAFGLARYGEFHHPQLSGDTAGAVAGEGPYSTHPPAYSMYLAAIFLSVPEFPELTFECIQDGSCAAARRLQRRARIVTTLVRGVTVSVAIVVALMLTGQLVPPR